MAARGPLFADPVPGSPPVGTSMQDARIALAALTGTVFQRAAGGAVTASGSNMNITVADATWVLPDVTTARGAFLGSTDQATLTPASGPATGSRIDTIAVKPDNYANGDADSKVLIQLFAGTAGASPVHPTLAAGWQRYLDIAVPTNAANAAACTITNYAQGALQPPELVVPTWTALSTITGVLAQYATVTSDPTAGLNGQYVWNGSAWVQVGAQGVWTALSNFSSGIIANGTFGYPPSYKLLGDSVVLAGAVAKSSAAVFADADGILTLPAAAAPTQLVRFTAPGDGAHWAEIQVAAGTGVMSIQSVKGTTPKILSLDGWTFRRV